MEQVVFQYLIQKKITFQQKPFVYTIDSTIPVGRGLGSSAALSAAFAGALLDYVTDRTWSHEEINNVAYQCEKIFHGNPSGADVSTSIFGGLIYFRKEFEFLKTISSLTLKIPQQIADNLFLIDTGKPRETTGEMVAQVGQLYNRSPRKMEHLLSEVEKTTKRMVVALAKEDVHLFHETLQTNQDLLSQMGVVSSKAQKIIDDLRPWGVGKVTGAGGKKAGSGFVLFATHDKEKVYTYGKEQKLDIIKLEPSLVGIQREPLL
jgi:mevalonate kinase